jgi:hypothetical protein
LISWYNIKGWIKYIYYRLWWYLSPTYTYYCDLCGKKGESKRKYIKRCFQCTSDVKHDEIGKIIQRSYEGVNRK